MKTMINGMRKTPGWHVEIFYSMSYDDKLSTGLWDTVYCRGRLSDRGIFLSAATRPIFVGFVLIF